MAQNIPAFKSAAESGEAVKAPIIIRIGKHNNNMTPTIAKTLFTFFKINSPFKIWSILKYKILFDSLLEIVAYILILDKKHVYWFIQLSY